MGSLHQAEESGQFKYSIHLDGTEIYSVINTTPKVWTNVQAEAARSDQAWAPNGENKFATGNFRNIQLISR